MNHHYVARVSGCDTMAVLALYDTTRVSGNDGEITMGVQCHEPHSPGLTFNKDRRVAVRNVAEKAEGSNVLYG